jgi:hypothetical protein
VWIGEVYRKPKTFRRRFKTKKDAEGYELYVKLTGEEPPTLENTQSTGAPTFTEAVEMAKAMKGPRGVWDLTNDESLCQRLDFVQTTWGPTRSPRWARRPRRPQGRWTSCARAASRSRTAPRTAT